MTATTDSSNAITINVTNTQAEAKPKLEDSTPIATSDAVAAKDSPAKISTGASKKRPSPDSKDAPNKRVNLDEDSGDSTAKDGNSEHDADCEMQVKVQQDLTKMKVDPSKDSCNQGQDKDKETVSSKIEDPHKDEKDPNNAQHQAAENPETVDVSPQEDTTNTPTNTQTTDASPKTEPEDSAVESVTSPDDDAPTPVEASQNSEASKKDEAPPEEQEKCSDEANDTNTTEPVTEAAASDDTHDTSNEKAGLATEAVTKVATSADTCETSNEKAGSVAASQQESEIPEKAEVNSSDMTQPTTNTEITDAPSSAKPLDLRSKPYIANELDSLLVKS